MKELLQKFREWQHHWNTYDFERSGKMPKNIDEFIEELEKQYEVKSK